MLRWAIVVLLAAGAAFVAVRYAWSDPPPPAVAAAAAEPPPPPKGPAVDAAQISSGRLSMERMPKDVGTALETFSNEIVRNAEETAGKQARIHGTCAPGSAIRVIAEDGTVRCQAIAHGVVTVAAVTAIPRLSGTVTEVGSVPGGMGRYQVDGETDYLVAPVALPDGAIVTSLSYVFFDASSDVDTEVFLYRSDNEAMASISSEGANESVRTISTDTVRLRKVDSRHAYFIYFRVSAQARAKVMPISASVSYKLQ
jgi:hypothetical protein